MNTAVIIGIGITCGLMLFVICIAWCNIRRSVKRVQRYPTVPAILTSHTFMTCFFSCVLDVLYFTSGYDDI